MLGPHSRSWTISRGLFQIFPLEATGILWEIETAVDRRLLCTNHPPALNGLGMDLLRTDSSSYLFIYCSGRWQWSKKASLWPPPPHCSHFIDKWHFLSHWLARKEPQSSLSVWRKTSVPGRITSWFLMNINLMIIFFSPSKLLFFKVPVPSLAYCFGACSFMALLKAQIKTY